MTVRVGLQEAQYLRNKSRVVGARRIQVCEPLPGGQLGGIVEELLDPFPPDGVDISLPD